MTRDELAHVLRAAATIVNDGDILVIGSQAILGTRDDDRLLSLAARWAQTDGNLLHNNLMGPPLAANTK